MTTIVPNELQPMGIHGVTGKPLHLPVKTEALAQWIIETLGGVGVRRAKPARMESEKIEFFGGLPDGLAPKELATTGWAVLWAPGTQSSTKDALSPLLQERKGAAGELYKEIDLEISPESGQLESVGRFLERHQVSPGTIAPSKLPYYLMIVGDPEQVPFEFQSALSVDYAVGRLSLDKPDAWRGYAEAVVLAEHTPIFAQNLTFFGPTNNGDPATTLSAQQLVNPLASNIPTFGGRWQIQKEIGTTATKQRLASLLYGNGRVPLIFSASHGIGYDAGDPRQLTRQGAIFCEQGENFAAEDLEQAGDLQGLVWFAFACFGAGTPKVDNFPGNPTLLSVQEIAPHSFQSALATRLLSHPPGPALGFFGHVDLAWSTSFKFGTADSQIADFDQCLRRIMKGHRLGHALNNLSQRYASLSTLLAVEMITALQAGVQLRRSTASLVARYWTAAMDARNYVLCGDPAAWLKTV